MPGPDYFVHETSLVDADAVIGGGTKIWHFCHVMKGAAIGKHCVLGQNVFVGAGVRIGDHVKIQNNVSVYEGVVLEDYVFCGPSMVFTNVVNPRSQIARKSELRSTIVRYGASLGANSTVICGVEIGRFAFIGAGTVVSRNVPDHALLYGNPGRLKGWICACGIKLPMSAATSGVERAVCAACGLSFGRDGTTVRMSHSGASGNS